MNKNKNAQGIGDLWIVIGDIPELFVIENLETEIHDFGLYSNCRSFVVLFVVTGCRIGTRLAGGESGHDERSRSN